MDFRGKIIDIDKIDPRYLRPGMLVTSRKLGVKCAVVSRIDSDGHYQLQDVDHLTMNVIKKRQPMATTGTTVDNTIKLSNKQNKVVSDKIMPEEAIQFQETPTRMAPKVLAEVRRFIVIKEVISGTAPIYDREGNLIGDKPIVWNVGDILEERMDYPNYFWNRSLLEREDMKSFMKYDNRFYSNSSFLKTIAGMNKSNLIPTHKCFNAFEEIDSIPAKDTFYFKHNGKKITNAYKSRMKKFALLNEELTNLREVLEINEEEDGL